jgi:alpha-N-arabinofuranosidase
MDSFIESVVSTCDHVRARMRSDRTVNLAFDEWNVWYLSQLGDLTGRDWQQHPPLIENVYTLADAVVVGSLLITLLRHADRVRIACLAQLVNAIAPIMTEAGGPAWRQTIFHPFALTARHARGGVVLRIEPNSPTIDTARYGAVPAIEATAVWREEPGDLAIFAVNRNVGEPLELEITLRDLNRLEVQHTTLAGPDPQAANNREHPNRVEPRLLEGTHLDGQRLRATLPPLSWNLLRLVPLRA